METVKIPHDCDHTFASVVSRFLLLADTTLFSECTSEQNKTHLQLLNDANCVFAASRTKHNVFAFEKSKVKLLPQMTYNCCLVDR